MIMQKKCFLTTLFVYNCFLQRILPVRSTLVSQFVPQADPNEISYASYRVYMGLLVDMLEKYDVNIRPRFNQSETVEVSTKFALNSIINFDTTGQRIDVMGYFLISWQDELLQWTPEDYERTNNIKLPLEKIWYPKLVLSKTYNDDKLIGDVKNDVVKISYDGLVTWVPDGLYSSICEVSVENYPFDEQICELIYYVSDEVIQTVRLQYTDDVQLHEYVENSEWRLIEVSTTVKERYTTNFVYITLKIQRRSAFTVYTMIIPLKALSLINVFTFLVPIDSGEKGSLAITLFLAYGFFISITRGSLPHNSVQTSNYIIYITGLLVLSFFTVIYVFFESKISACMGTSHFKMCCGIVTNKVHSFNSRAMTKADDALEREHKMDKQRTWAEVLKKLDFIMFVVSFVFISVYSVSLWTTVI